MFSFDLSLHEIYHIHLVGIGGISMSAIAEILLKHGYRVSGSDIKDSNLLEKLRNHGAEIFIGHSAENIHNPDLIVYTAAIKDNNPERVRAKELNIPEIDRAEMLGSIMKKYKKAIAVSGSHGKTTTTSLISLILEYSGLDPTILVGGELDEIGGNIKIGASPHFITEACEYVESFLKFHPFIGVILNIDEDHLDYFKNIDHIKEAFKKFALKIPNEGFLIANNDDANVKELFPHIKCNIITYGLWEKSHFTATDIKFNTDGFPSFRVIFEGETYGYFQLSVPGYHNIYNSLASIATAHVLGVSPEDICKHISIYKGIHRRFDLLGEVNGAKIIDDYAHHPAEIRATLEAAKNYPHRNIWCIFQPHTYTRTQALLTEFAKSFDDADHVIITDIYAARELDEGKIHSSKMVELMSHPDAKYMKNFHDIVNHLYDNLQPQDLVLTMGAGDVYKIGEGLLEKENGNGIK
ncbi:UDP-N-acetylmuramate--L-alanine ligase [Alkaliphilus peptidifermentans]|uniref:UDP-N-acetylmuramate--L-alanine ligase n=1 Tax=Alkaliphilus peptidifermentans DSM 18978 TaxID=1120976 RepID=A0A1G5AM30_9FIRM|nr:UDP-N-acetylmuramate--L-alanine ligase [Alkaliphilus peptidifermentans]SCX78912.1 UDP-N-acetylmuramate--L-alanine ligase [Alkaliphilus peptidifermentans DSM 18978]